METKSHKGFRIRHADWVDKTLFGIFAVGGVTWLILGLQYGAREIFVTGSLIALMIIYVAAGFTLGKVALRPDQIGDNSYYLGFVFTLASLSYSLATFNFLSQDIQAVRSIVSNFGIALSTTGVGILLRVLLHQMRVDPADVERNARISLSESSLRLRAELDQVVMHLNSFGAATQQSIADAFDQISGNTKTALASSTSTVETAIENAAKSLDDALSKITADTNQLEVSSNKLNVAIEQLIQKIDSIDVAPDLISKKLEPSLDAVEKVMRRLERRMAKEDERSAVVDALLERSSTTTAHFEKASALAEKSALAIDATVRTITAADKETSRLANSAVTAANALEGLGPKIAESISAISNVLHKEDERSEAIDRLLQRSAAMVEQFEKTATLAEGNLADLAAIVRGVSDADKETARLASAASTAAEALSAIERIGPRVTDSLLAIASMVTKAQESMEAPRVTHTKSASPNGTIPTIAASDVLHAEAQTETHSDTNRNGAGEVAGVSNLAQDRGRQRSWPFGWISR